LEREGLARSQPRRGTVVVGVTPTDIQQIFAIRLMIELEAGRRAARLITRQDIARLDSCIVEMNRASERGQADVLCNEDLAFHREFISCSRDRWLLIAWKPLSGVVKTILSLTDLYFRDVDERRLAIASHQPIVD